MNQLNAAETRSLLTLTRIRECTDVRLLNRAARLFLVWDNRRYADKCHMRRLAVLNAKLASR
jgi:hypothetical protein